MTELSARQRTLAIYVSLAVVTAVVYWPVRHFPFVNYDDPPCLYENPHLKHGLTASDLRWAFTTGQDQWMPVTWVARILVWQLFGADAGGHHLINVAIHIANTLLLFGILKRMTGGPWRSALVAGLFALHPLHVESVAWATGLKDVLSLFFGLLSIWAYARYVEEFTGRDALRRVHGPTDADTTQRVPTKHLPSTILHEPSPITAYMPARCGTTPAGSRSRWRPLAGLRDAPGRRLSAR